MKEVPVKIEQNGAWVGIRLAIDEDHMVIPAPVNRKVPFRDVVNLEERKNLLVVTVKGEPESVYRILTVEKVIAVMRRLILTHCNGYRLNAYFLSPAVRGGVLVTDAQWEKGSIVVVRTGIWFASAGKQVCIPLLDVADIELTKKEVQGRQSDVVKIDHVDAGEVVTSFVLCPISTLQILFNFLTDATKSMEMKGDELDEYDQQVAMLVYSGMDSSAIISMLSVNNKRLNTIYDKLLNLGIAEVVEVRREVKLTTKGIKYIADATKQ
ncbi:Chemotaxis signal transduction system protein F from archaea [anaerobic digester metagenome]